MPKLFLYKLYFFEKNGWSQMKIIEIEFRAFYCKLEKHVFLKNSRIEKVKKDIYFCPFSKKFF